MYTCRDMLGLAHLCRQVALLPRVGEGLGEDALVALLLGLEVGGPLAQRGGDAVVFIGSSMAVLLRAS